jgi:transmembrane sensor
MPGMNTQIYEEASDWLIRNREGTLGAADKARFDAWLRESPHHVRAYLEMTSMWEDVSSLDSSWNASAEELVRQARGQHKVVPLGETRTPMRLSAPGARSYEMLRSQPRKRLWYGLAASILVAALVGWLYSAQRDTYSTAIGEQRSVWLADGSTIELNSRSRVRVRFTGRERAIDLLEGQALFHVAKNATRPFIVRTDSTRIRAVGTQFDVYRTRSATLVTVVEGRVAVEGTARRDPADTRPTSSAEDLSGRPVSIEPGVSGSPTLAAGQKTSPLVLAPGELLLGAGEQLSVTPQAMAKPAPANIASAMAWTRRNLVFDFSSLTDVAEEFNRYNTRQLIIDDPQLADFHISGVFSSVDPELLLRFLRSQPELNVEETDGEIRISKK